MAERDPFGRLPDENPLAGLGALSDGTQAQAAEPVVSAKPEWSGAQPAAKPKPAAPPRRTRTTAADQSIAEVVRQVEAQAKSQADAIRWAQRVGRVTPIGIATNVVRELGKRAIQAAVVILVIWGIVSVAGPILNIGKDVRDAVDDIPSSGGIELPGSSAGEAEAPPVGLSTKSVLRPATFDSAMKRLRRSGLGRMQSLTIRPERMSIQLLTKGGSLRSLQMRFDDSTIDALSATPGLSHLETVPFAKLDTAAPQRLARSAAGRARLPVSRVDYVTLNVSQGEVTWGAYLKGGKIYLANAHGRITRRIS